MLRKLFVFVASLQLTLICLAAAILLIFTGTIAQVHLGIHEAQQRYFQSLFVWWPPNTAGFKLPIFPGGHLIGAVLLINLVAAHAKRFQWAWRKLGIHLTHAGLIIMLAGGLFTDLFAVESHMHLTPGDTKNYSEGGRLMELAVIDTTAPAADQVTAIPESLLKREGTINHPSLPFTVVVRKFFENSRLHMLGAGGPSEPIANRGPGARIAVERLPRATGVDQRDVASAIIEIVPAAAQNSDRNQSLGKWLVSDALGRAADIFLGRAHVGIGASPGPLLQTLQRDPAKVLARRLSRH